MNYQPPDNKAPPTMDVNNPPPPGIGFKPDMPQGEQSQPYNQYPQPNQYPPGQMPMNNNNMYWNRVPQVK